MGDKEGNSEEKPKPEGPSTMVIRLDLHCDGCALKLKSSIKRFDGVEAVSVDVPNNKLVVIREVDPVMLRQQIEEKTRKKVDLVSTDGGDAKPNKDGDTNKLANAAISGGGDAKEAKKTAEEKKAKSKAKVSIQPQPSIVVLKIRLHCEGCIHRIRKTIFKIKGVEDVFVESGKDLVTVKGTMDSKMLPTILRDKLKRGVEIIPSKKENGGGDKKEEKVVNEKNQNGGEKKESGNGEKNSEKNQNGEEKKESGNEEKNIEGGGGGGGGGGDKKNSSVKIKKEDENNDNDGEKDADKEIPIAKMEYYGSNGYTVEMAPTTYGYGTTMAPTLYEYNVNMPQTCYGYGIEMAQAPHKYGLNMTHAPQMFNDENPNACFIM